jgi:hypothetical protein
MLKLYSGTTKDFPGEKKNTTGAQLFKPDTTTTLSDQIVTWHRQVQLMEEVKARDQEKKQRLRRRTCGMLHQELIALGVTFTEAGDPVLPM